MGYKVQLGEERSPVLENGWVKHSVNGIHAWRSPTCWESVLISIDLSTVERSPSIHTQSLAQHWPFSKKMLCQLSVLHESSDARTMQRGCRWFYEQ